MSSRTLLPILALALIVLQACAALFPPLYRPYSNEVGYSDLQVGKDTWEVQYVGPTSQTELQAEEMAILRAAELTHLSGARWFLILSDAKESRRMRVTTHEVNRTSVPDTASRHYLEERKQVEQEVTTRQDAWVPVAKVRFQTEKEDGDQTLDADAVMRIGGAKGLMTKKY
jgi:hypothetical protein